MSNITRRQHFVPRTYLKNFAFNKNKEFYIHSLPKDNTDPSSIFEINIKNICVEKDLYTLPSENLEDKMFIENFYNENYETHYDKIFKLLTNSNREKLTESEHLLIISTVITMLYRTKKWITDFNTFTDKIFELAYYGSKELNKDFFTYENEKIEIKDKTLSEIQKIIKDRNKSIQTTTLLKSALKLIEIRKNNDAIMISKIEDNSIGFITSDNPISLSNLKVKNFSTFDPTNTLTLPIDETHLLHLIPITDENSKLFLARDKLSGILSEAQIISTNLRQFENAEKFLIGNHNSLKKFILEKNKRKNIG